MHNFPDAEQRELLRYFLNLQGICLEASGRAEFAWQRRANHRPCTLHTTSDSKIADEQASPICFARKWHYQRKQVTRRRGRRFVPHISLNIHALSYTITIYFDWIPHRYGCFQGKKKTYCILEQRYLFMGSRSKSFLCFYLRGVIPIVKCLSYSKYLPTFHIDKWVI